MFTKIRYVNLVVSDQDKALTFYARLGLEKRIDYPGPDGRFLTLGFAGQDMELMLWKGNPSISMDGSQANSDPGFLFLESADLRAACSALAAEGVTFDREVEDYPFGVRATVIDPDGNRVELRQGR